MKGKSRALPGYVKKTALRVTSRFDGVLILGDVCPLRRSTVTGRAGRALSLSDHLCVKTGEHGGCRYLVGFGHEATVLCGHLDAKSDFHSRRLALQEEHRRPAEGKPLTCLD